MSEDWNWSCEKAAFSFQKPSKVISLISLPSEVEGRGDAHTGSLQTELLCCRPVHFLFLKMCSRHPPTGTGLDVGPWTTQEGGRWEVGGFRPQLPSARSLTPSTWVWALPSAHCWGEGTVRGTILAARSPAGGRGECALGRWVAWLLSPAHTGSPVPQLLPHGAGELWGSVSAVGPESAFPHILGPGRLAGFLLVPPGDDT